VKAYGEGFSAIKEFDIPLKAATHELVLDLAAMKIAPGEYTFALQSLGICKYSYNDDKEPKDTVDIFISEPVRLSVKPAAVTTAAK
jgi:hypothetical protein